ncbi:MAG: S1 RNA-binding domain-containing protein [Acidobacteriota bacterium]
MVEYIGNTFAKVQASDVKAVIFLREMSDEYIEHPSAVLHEGQTVEFVLLGPSEKRPDEWVGSINGASEARSRAALSRLSPGDRIDGQVSDLKDRGAILDAGEFEVWVPITELAWSWIDHPSEAVSLGQAVTVEILRVELPDGWLNDKRQRRAKAVGSIRAAIPQPESPIIPVAFSGLPFKVSAVARTPRACDPVVLYLLEELVGARSPEDVQATTGLPRQTLDGVHQVLAAEGLVKDWRPTAKGKRLAEAVSLARALTADPIRGLFVSSAHPSAQFVRAGSRTAAADYPPSWPRPPFNKQAEEEFARASDESIPELLIDRIVTAEKRELLSRLQEDDRMHVFLRRDGSRPWKAVYVPTPEHWLLAGLWCAFDPIGSTPFRPANVASRCRDFLMVRASALVRKNGKPVATLYFEPNTKTLWHLRDEARVRFRERKCSVFPDLPELKRSAATLPSGEEVKHLQPESWCIAGVR